ncbi:response regulator transcription factor [Paenibacillus sp. 23TSA30-6]|uniref:response regulator transcription factor n=1 Tax=Paenibacillus sp. 23TSA30-6 TaxID=2546104 RepID=UPI0017877E7A|nr:response regulator transcription factor [Paenibacillus sp. 23TSA30-6]MBE0336509.1 response regulator transcription factor [Paenibacillus sp. 23TSA30-6]
MASILAIDDDIDILILIKNILQRDQHLVYTHHMVKELPLEAFLGYDLILLDVMMPDLDGFELCKKIRKVVECPIVFLTAKVGEEAIVNGLMIGGDDYITKPFGVHELSARISAHLRRENREKHPARMLISGITFDFGVKEISVQEIKIPLTKNEYKICEFLAKNKGRIFTREEIYDEVYGLDGCAQFATITEFIRSIRKKFSPHHTSPIHTVWGVGYKWD